MKVTKHGKTIPFCCPACGCEFVAGINEITHYFEHVRNDCECPDCGAKAEEPIYNTETAEGGRKRVNR